jgi:hypothetical protein
LQSGSTVKFLPTKYKALSSNSSTTHLPTIPHQKSSIESVGPDKFMWVFFVLFLLYFKNCCTALILG